MPQVEGVNFGVVCPIGPMVSMSCWSYVVPSSVSSVYYEKNCLKFASHHFFLYAVYICQKSLNFTYAFKCYLQNCSWLHFTWTTLYIAWGTGVPLPVPGRLPDQFPKVWRSFVYRFCGARGQFLAHRSLLSVVPLERCVVCLSVCLWRFVLWQNGTS